MNKHTAQTAIDPDRVWFSSLAKEWAETKDYQYRLQIIARAFFYYSNRMEHMIARAFGLFDKSTPEYRLATVLQNIVEVSKK